MVIDKGNYKLYNGDCLEVMDKLIEEGIIFDAIITDPPYGTTDCKWDNIIDIDKMFDRIDKLIKPNGVILLFSQQPFTSDLINAYRKNFRYEIILEKTKPVGFFNAKKMPLRSHENITVFYKKLPTYNPELVDCNKKIKRTDSSKVYGTGKGRKNEYVMTKTGYPRSVIKFSNVFSPQLHPTQKNTEMLEYLVKMYTNEGDLVLDFTCGSGSTGVACLNTNRRFVGIELDEKYFNISCERLEKLS